MDENREAQKRVHRINLLFPLILILAVTLFSLLRGGSSGVVTQIDSENGVLGIANAIDSSFLYLDDIQSVEYVENFDAGTPETEATETVRYTNAAFGPYLLYACGDTTDVVVIRTEEQIIAVNAKNEKATEKFYNELVKALG